MNKQFEYKTVFVPIQRDYLLNDGALNLLNEQGKLGWELAFIKINETSYSLLLKRETKYME